MRPSYVRDRIFGIMIDRDIIHRPVNETADLILNFVDEYAKWYHDVEQKIKELASDDFDENEPLRLITNVKPS